MSYNTGYVTLPVTSYSAWKQATNGNGYNFDNSYGCQCYDLVVEFWWNVGFPQGYPVITNSSAYTMWNNREQNKAYNGVVYFDLIYNLADVKQGDVLVKKQATNNTLVDLVGNLTLEKDMAGLKAVKMGEEYVVSFKNEFPECCLNLWPFDYRR